jgi:Lrp/AsnC family transcriptional regulator of lysine biosynthesis
MTKLGVDDTDKKILELLKKNAREKYVKIAKEVSLTEGAVRQRVKKMMNLGIIRRFTVDIGTAVEAIILVNTDPAETNKITRQMKEISGKVYEVSGEYDIAVLVEADNMDELNSKVDKVRRIQGVLNTNTLIRLLNG